MSSQISFDLFLDNTYISQKCMQTLLTHLHVPISFYPVELHSSNIMRVQH